MGFSKKELQRAPRGDMRLNYDYEQIKEAYLQCEEQFAKEFTTFMDKLGASSLEETTKKDNTNVEGGPISGHLHAMRRRLQPLTVQRPDWL